MSSSVSSRLVDFCRWLESVVVVVVVNHWMLASVFIVRCVFAFYGVLRVVCNVMGIVVA